MSAKRTVLAVACLSAILGFLPGARGVLVGSLRDLWSSKGKRSSRGKLAATGSSGPSSGASSSPSSERQKEGYGFPKWDTTRSRSRWSHSPSRSRSRSGSRKSQKQYPLPEIRVTGTLWKDSEEITINAECPILDNNYRAYKKHRYIVTVTFDRIAGISCDAFISVEDEHNFRLRAEQRRLRRERCIKERLLPEKIPKELDNELELKAVGARTTSTIHIESEPGKNEPGKKSLVTMTFIEKEPQDPRTATFDKVALWIDEQRWPFPYRDAMWIDGKLKRLPEIRVTGKLLKDSEELEIDKKCPWLGIDYNDWRISLKYPLTVSVAYWYGDISCKAYTTYKAALLDEDEHKFELVADPQTPEMVKDGRTTFTVLSNRKKEFSEMMQELKITNGPKDPQTMKMEKDGRTTFTVLSNRKKEFSDMMQELKKFKGQMGQMAYKELIKKLSEEHIKHKIFKEYEKFLTILFRNESPFVEKFEAAAFEETRGVADEKFENLTAEEEAAFPKPVTFVDVELLIDGKCQTTP